MLKRMIAGVIALSVAMSAAPINIMAESVSGPGIEYEEENNDTPARVYDDEDEEEDYTPPRRNNYDDDDDDDDYTPRSSEKETEVHKPVIDAQFIYAENSTEATTVSMIVDQSGISTPEGVVANIPVGAQSAVLLDAKTGIMLYGKYADTKMYPASVTKVMTLLLACEKGNLEDMVTVSQNAVNSIPYDSSKADLSVDEKISLNDLLYDLILLSGNDAAVVIAEHIAGSEQAFVDMMNERAKELGCTNTHFANAHGYHREDHYTTAHDMALIAMAVAQNEKAKKIWGSPDRTIPATNKHESHIINHTDKMLQPTTQFYDERVKGGKTGFHNQAGNTLTTYAVNGDVELIVVVMKNSGYDAAYKDTKQILDFGFGLYSEKKLCGRDDFDFEIPVVQNYKGDQVDLGNVRISISKDITAFTPGFVTHETATIMTDLPEKLTGPINKNDVVGTLTVSYGGYEYGKADIIALGSVEEIPEAKLNMQNTQEVVEKAIKVLSIATIVFFAGAAAVIFGLRAWFISQRKRRKAKKQNNKNDRKRKVKIKLK